MNSLDLSDLASFEYIYFFILPFDILVQGEPNSSKGTGKLAYQSFKLFSKPVGSLSGGNLTRLSQTAVLKVSRGD